MYWSVGLAVIALAIREVQVLLFHEPFTVTWWFLEVSRWAIAGVVMWVLASMAMRLGQRMSRMESQLAEIGVVVEIERLGLAIEDKEDGIIETVS